MDTGEKKQHSFVSRYWVVIVIVLWVLVWLALGESAPNADETPEDEAVEAVDDEEREAHAAEPDAMVDPPAEEAATVVGAAADARSVLDSGREAYWRAGPEAAARVLAEGLDALPEDADGRADVYGELGNALFASGDAEGAMAAWESALERMADAERQAMIERLEPVYMRYHTGGAAHLEQYR